MLIKYFFLFSIDNTDLGEKASC